MPIVTWFPLLKVEPPSSLATPVDVNTPILHLNGLSDPIVPLIPAGSKSKVVMEEIFSNYELKNRICMYSQNNHESSEHTNSQTLVKEKHKHQLQQFEQLGWKDSWLWQLGIW